MIIWSEKQYKAFLEKAHSVMPEPTKVEPAMPVSPVARPVILPSPSPVYVNNWTRPVFLVCLTVVAVVGMVHEKPSNATVSPVKVEQVAKPTHKIKLHHHKKVVDSQFKKRIIAKSDTPDIEEIEARLTTVEERLDNDERSVFLP